MGYDTEGMVTSRTDGNEHVWELKRNQLEQITEEKTPTGKITKEKYEKAGDPESVEDPEKHVTEYTYDESDRPKTVKYSTGKPSEVTYEYNKDSLVKKMTDGTGTTENTWDKLDRLEKYKSGAGKTVEYSYNLDNEPKKIVYPNGKSVIREYDGDGRLESVTDWNSHVTSFKYNADSELEKIVFPSGTEEEDTYSYDKDDQMTEAAMKGPLGSNLGKLVYERDGDEQLKKTTTTTLPGPATIEDKYDGDNRLTEDNALAYEYDKANDPTKILGSGPYTYNEADQLKEGPTAKYGFNEDGQRTKTEPKSGEPATIYGYDQAGNLSTIERAEGPKQTEIKDSYTYNGNNLRQKQTINGTTTNLTWDTAEELPLILSDETNSYIYGPENTPIEQIAESGGTTLYLHHDQQGSTRLLTSSAGVAEGAYTYNPYGTTLEHTGTATSPLQYDGQYTSKDTGFIYMRARVYDPETAQYLSIDPAVETTGEPYSYTADNPPNTSDPSGEITVPYQDRPPVITTDPGQIPPVVTTDPGQTPPVVAADPGQPLDAQTLQDLPRRIPIPQRPSSSGLGDSLTLEGPIPLYPTSGVTGGTGTPSVMALVQIMHAQAAAATSLPDFNRPTVSFEGTAGPPARRFGVTMVRIPTYDSRTGRASNVYGPAIWVGQRPVIVTDPPAPYSPVPNIPPPNYNPR